MVISTLRHGPNLIQIKASLRAFYTLQVVQQLPQMEEKQMTQQSLKTQQKREIVREVMLSAPEEIHLQIKDVAAAMAALKAACKGDLDKLARIEAITACSLEQQERWLLKKVETQRNLLVGCALVTVTVGVVVGYIIVKYFDEVTKTWRQEREAVIENKEVEKMVCE